MIQTQYAPPSRDINAPDLYIPMMGFLTYILIVGYSKGTTNQYVHHLPPLSMTFVHS